MPNIEYCKTLIYKIECKDPAIKYIFIGATTDLRRMRAYHKLMIENASDNFIYTKITEHGGWDNWQIVILEKYIGCTSKAEANIRVDQWEVAINNALVAENKNVIRSKNPDNLINIIESQQEQIKNLEQLITNNIQLNVKDSVGDSHTKINNNNNNNTNGTINDKNNIASTREAFAELFSVDQKIEVLNKLHDKMMVYVEKSRFLGHNTEFIDRAVKNLINKYSQDYTEEKQKLLVLYSRDIIIQIIDRQFMDLIEYYNE